MAYTTSYSDLIAELQTVLEENGAEFIGQLPNIVSLAELEVVRDLDLEIFKKTLTGTFVAGQRNQAKPAGLIKTDGVSITTLAGAVVPMEPRSRDYCDMFAPVAATQGAPLYYADLSESEWYVVATPDDAYSFTARGPVRPDPLSDTNETNWLTDNVGDLLRFAALIECEHFLIDPVRVDEWRTEYSQKLDATLLELGGQRRNKYTPLRKTPSKSSRPEE